MSNMVNVRITDRKFYKCIKTILNMTIEEALKYVNDLELTHIRLVEYINDYFYYNPDFLSQEKIGEVEKFLNEVKVAHLIIARDKFNKSKSVKFRNAKIVTNKNRISEDIYLKYRHLLEDYANNEDYVYNIIKKYGIDYNFFMDLVAFSSFSNNSYDKELYNKVSDLLATKEYKVNIVIESIAPLVLGYIEEGIECGNEVVPFTFFDYYTNFKIPFEYFLLYQGDKISVNDLDKLETFYAKSYHALKKEVTFTIFKNATFFNMKYELKTEYTFSVNGEYIKPTLEERQQVVNYLINNDYPLDLVIYKQALRRYANGLLDINVNLKRTYL